jgi:hypothetical protein
METVAWIAAGLVFATFCAHDQVQMRSFALLSNIAFISYATLGVQEGIFEKVLPILVLHSFSFVLNVGRLRQAVTTGEFIEVKQK